MSELARWVEDIPNHPWIIFAIIAWNVAWLIWHAISESKRPRLRPEDIVYEDSTQSARRLTNLWTWIGDANRCMQVTLLRDRIIVRPHFPFSALGRFYGLDLEIPYENVHEAAMVDLTEDSKIVETQGIRSAELTRGGAYHETSSQVQKPADSIDSARGRVYSLSRRAPNDDSMAS